MKRIILFIFALFTCIGAIAETTDLKFVIDNETYATQTCTVGGAVNLPPTPTKYGYDFDGWQPVFYRGTFATWNDIPTSTGGYLGDTNGSNVPHENDYIIVNDASGVPEYGETIEIRVKSGGDWSWQYRNTYINEVDYGFGGYLYNENIYTYQNQSCDPYKRYCAHWKSNTKTVVSSGIKYEPGNDFYSIPTYSCTAGKIYYAKFINSYPYSGKWLLRYHGNWADYNRGGWVAEKQLD